MPEGPRTALEATRERDGGAERRAVYLHAGQVFVSPHPAEVTTVLGSCVAVCVFDTVLRLGGTNHYLLPHWAGNGLSSARFGNVAVRALIDRMLALGSRKGDLEAKVFGGACTVEAFQGRQGHLGARNAEVALKALRQEGVAVVADDVGGRRGRKLVFHTDTGLALVRLL